MHSISLVIYPTPRLETVGILLLAGLAGVATGVGGGEGGLELPLLTTS